MPKDRATKRFEADCRRIESDARTPEAQLQLVMERPGKSIKETTKLMLAIKAETDKIVADRSGQVTKKPTTKKKAKA